MLNSGQKGKQHRKFFYVLEAAQSGAIIMNNNNLVETELQQSRSSTGCNK